MLEGTLTVSVDAQINPPQHSKTPAAAVPQLEPGRSRTDFQLLFQTMLPTKI